MKELGFACMVSVGCVIIIYAVTVGIVDYLLGFIVIYSLPWDRRLLWEVVFAHTSTDTFSPAIVL